MDGIGQRVINGIGQRVINGISFYIASAIYRIGVRRIIISGFICIPIYYLYVSIICQNTWLLPSISKFCPAQEINVLSYLPLDSLTKNTVSLADTLSNADVSAPLHCVQANLAFIEIRAGIIESDIKPEIKNNLVDTILDLQKLTDKGAEQATNMLTSYDSALTAIKFHTEFLLDDLSKSQNSNNYQSQQLQIESSDMKSTNVANESYNDYINEINKQLDNALFKTQEFHTTLSLIIGKIETIQVLIKKGKKFSELELAQLEKDSFWIWIFGKDVVNIKKHKLNIETLDEFNVFMRKLSKNTADIITKLLEFKSYATNLKNMAAQLDTSQYKSPERQLQIIKASIMQLAQSKQAFEKQMEKENREKYFI